MWLKSPVNTFTMTAKCLLFHRPESHMGGIHILSRLHLTNMSFSNLSSVNEHLSGYAATQTQTMLIHQEIFLNIHVQRS